jgi:protein-disulfide isomerase
MTGTPKMRTTSRRALLAASGALTTLALLGCGKKADDVVMSDGETRGDNVLGDPNAPVTVIEYASVTCPHCKAFHDDVYPELKSRYIDTGKVRFVFREFPTPPTALAMAGFLMARCAPEDKYFDVLDILFDKQNELYAALQAGTARDELLKIAQPLGMSPEQFDACVRDTTKIERIEQVVEDGAREFGVNSTPSFVIGGKTYAGEMPIERFEELIDPLLNENG